MRYLLPILFLVLLIGCPKPDEKLDPAICDDGYHPCGPDSQECCLDTTGHAFTWEIDTIGLNGSDLFDVAIISENDIWAVGEIHIYDPDSTNGTDEALFNAAHWDGEQWSTLVIYDNSPLRGIFAFSSDDIWFMNGTDIFHYDGNDTERLLRTDYEQFGFFIVNTAWGTSSSNMYFAGYRGNVFHYDGSVFTHQQTGYDTDFRNITGTANGDHVFIVGNPKYRFGEDVVLHSNNSSNWEHIPYPPDPDGNDGLLDTYSADISGNNLYISTEFDLWIYDIISGESELNDQIFHIEKLFKFTSAESPNDIFFGGSKFDYIHYNGVSYKYVNDINEGYRNIEMKGGDFRDDVAIMVGNINSWEHSLVARGYRN